MLILISNDDGYYAPGIKCLNEYISRIAQTIVVAPDRNKSGASNSLTLKQPLRVQQVEENKYHVDGTPTDCVHLALTGLLDNSPDLVISGINDSANLGDDTIYSGTVAAAMEARFLGIPSFAISLDSKNRDPQHFETAARVMVDIVERLKMKPLHAPMMFNINVPDVPYASVKGIRATRLGSRHKSEAVIKTKAPNNINETLYWIGAAGKAFDIDDGTDFHAVEQGYVSVTPLTVDLTAHKQLSMVTTWLDSDDTFAGKLATK